MRRDRSFKVTTARVTVTDSASVLAFESTGDGFDRFLTVKGKPAYHLGNVCGTCSFLFERLEGANQSISAAEILRNRYWTLNGRVNDSTEHLIKSTNLRSELRLAAGVIYPHNSGPALVRHYPVG